MQNDMSQRENLSKKIMSTLQQLHQRFPKNISFEIDEYGKCNITIKKDCGGSNVPIRMFQCRCCETVIEFAKKFNEHFEFLLELDTPLDFIKLSFHNNAHSVRIFEVAIKKNFFDSCGFTGLSDNFNPCNIEEDEFRNIVKIFYNILGRKPPVVSKPANSVIGMFNDDDAKYRGGAGIQTRSISRPKHKSKYKYKNSYFKKYKKLRKNNYSNKLRVKKYNRRTKRRMGA